MTVENHAAQMNDDDTALDDALPVVLIIDDNDTTHATVRAILGGEKYNIHGAKDGQSGLDLYALLNPVVTLLDLHMPGMSGQEVLAAMDRALLQRHPVIVLTGEHDPVAVDHCFALGALHYLEKPIQPAQLRGAVASAVRSYDYWWMREESLIQELGESYVLYEGINHAIRDGIIVVREDGIVANINPAACRMLDCMEHKLLGQSIEAVLPQSLLTELQTRHETQWKLRDGAGIEKNLRVDMSPIGTGGMQVFTLSDITALKQHEAETLQMTEKMQRFQRIQAMGTLAAGIAHDFNNLLGAIQSHAEIADIKLGVEASAYKNIQAILQAAARARDIVAKLNAMHQESEGELSALCLWPLLQETQTLLSFSLKGVNIRVQGEADAYCLVRGNSTDIQQVLSNLCINAGYALANRRDGQIDIRYLEIPPGSRQLPQVVITVTDNGCGIPAKILPHIFEPFFTTREVGEGSGLGLSMAHGIVTRMGGTIECKSTEGVGTCFTLAFPVVAEGA